MGSNMHTDDPVALRYLMTETIFGMEGARDIETPRETIPVLAPTFLYHGENRRNYLFVTHETRYDWMSAEALEAFTKTLSALKLTIADVAVLNFGKLSQVPTQGELVAFFRPRVVVALSAPLDWNDVADITVFRTYSFDEMLVDAEKKRLFWNTIKTLLI